MEYQEKMILSERLAYSNTEGSIGHIFIKEFTQGIKFWHCQIKLVNKRT